MLILLPPSEGKTAPTRGRALDLAALSFPELRGARQTTLDALVRLCDGDPAVASTTLGLGRTQLDEVERNAGLLDAPTARADHVYSGVLYEALDLPGLSGPAKRRASGSVVIMSALFGAVRPQDRIPGYRLSGDVKLPGVGAVARHWAAHLAEPMTRAAGRGLVLDLRSSTYAGFWKPTGPVKDRTIAVRVLHEHHGELKVVSHFNKATKGRLVRALLEDGGTPRTARGPDPPSDRARLDDGARTEAGRPRSRGQRAVSSGPALKTRSTPLPSA